MSTYTARERAVSYVALAAAIALQIHAVAVGFWGTPVFAQLFAGLGGELPTITRAFFAARPFLWLLPVAFLGLSFDVLRRPSAPISYFVSVLVASTVAGFGLHAWIVHAMYRPLYEILRKIG